MNKTLSFHYVSVYFIHFLLHLLQLCYKCIVACCNSFVKFFFKFFPGETGSLILCEKRTGAKPPVL